jgi:hypothetical protein
MLSLAQHYERSGDLRRWVGYVILVIFASTCRPPRSMSTKATRSLNIVS